MSDAKDLVLVVEDEPQMRRFLRASLGAEGYRVREAWTIADGVREAAAEHPDAILLDLGLPDGDGLELVRRVREWSSVPVIVVSARGREEEKVAALDAGADDYLPKPFGTKELLARLRVALRHSRAAASPGSPVLEAGPLRMDLERREATVRRARGAPHPHRVAAPRLPRDPRRQGAHPRPDPARGLGTERVGAVPLRAGLHGRAAQEARGRSRRGRASCSPSPAWGTGSPMRRRRRASR